MSIIHIVMFQFGENATPKDIEEACQRMLALKDECLHPVTQKPYIQRISGGLDNSPEGKQGGITHAFVAEFSSAEDRDYYIKDDSTHKLFAQSLSGLVARAQVIDFTPGVF
ncbi:stress responsive A/B barrel domain-containing protein [Colletotrichum truncatum]|uniref:Stress responsive A/B barrel domain-containing protein n=1 Tax=Colletotrichum truncatum TaxID=5467 RepID=A0ACC3YUG6_COLTU|nr:stress responsive A/B barrel domain-containing protein [Colletotrichum truncatum]KAF6785070.1 stress responsive A/B barrel domain-containing protein [Colletotrichum truncatum]